MLWIIIGLIILVIVSTLLYIEICVKRRIRDRISFKESMDLTELPIITLTNNGVKLNFLIDTGSNQSVIDEKLVKVLSGEKVPAQNTVTGLAGEVQLSSLFKMGLSYKNNCFIETLAIIDMTDSFNSVKNEYGVQLHGILGTVFFERYKYIIDFKDLVIYR